MLDVAQTLGLNAELLMSDGEESGWPQNSALSLVKLMGSGYPTLDYEQLLRVIKTDFLV